MTETTHSEQCWKWHPDCAVEHGRADERRKLADQYRSIADDPDVLREWRDTRGLYAASVPAAGATLRVVAAELENRLGGYPGTPDPPSEPEPLIDPDCRSGKCGSCVGGPCEHDCHTGGGR